ncbi:MAG TPA: poly-beta-1,6 N-acetyl-D-glucosamine export porin PgaA [Stellaceae bacterium]|nr:poly-beta-1,6 N-acetyl-D-glucosamine export porin PgaA [Stellaceae bacterium]
MNRTALRSLLSNMRRLGRTAVLTTPGRRAATALVGILALVPAPLVMAQDVQSAAAQEQRHAEAVRLARAGNTSEAISILEELARNDPRDKSVSWDLIVILTWAGKDAEALQLFERQAKDDTPEYVVEAAARAYRNLHRLADSTALYRRGRQRWPKNPSFVAGEIESLTDMGDAKAALRVADEAQQPFGDKVPILIAAAYAALGADVPIDALRHADRALALEPGNRDALRLRVLAIEALNMSGVALRLARANPGLLSADEIRRLEGDSAAALVRWGPLESKSEADRFAATDRAIAELDGLINRWSQEGPVARASVTRARLDRLIALQQRSRMTEVVAEYEAMVREDVSIPNYVLSAIASAYLYLRQPEQARDLYRRAVAADPKNVDAQLGLFHALIETEEFDEARRVVDAAAAGLSPWIYLKGAVEPIPNNDKFAADVAAANQRLYADDLPEAQLRFAGLADAAPQNTEARVGLADVYAARGWPRLAQEELEIAHAQKTKDLGIEAAQARTALALHDWPRADAGISDLARRFPEALEVQQLLRDWDVHNRWELQISSERDLRRTVAAIGGNALTVGAQLYSPPIDDNWRIFGGDRLAHERAPEGNVTERLYDVGVDYRGIDFTAAAQALYAEYGPHRGGLLGTASWTPDDRWQIGGSGSVFSPNTPLRALLNRITADEVDLSVAYRESDSRTVSGQAQVLPFSDGNLRTGLSSHGEQRLYTAPLLRLNGTVDLAASQNTRIGAPYFNPRHDALGAFGFDARQILYRRYDFSYDHRLIATFGPYWEQGFGTGVAWGMRYEQRVKYDDTVELTLGTGYTRQPYDGVYENSLAFTLYLNLRF